MSSIVVAPVRTEQDRRSFFELPYRIYADDRRWVPPLDAWLKRRLSPKSKFFRAAEIDLYLARRGEEIVGTVSVLRDHRHEQHTGEKAVFFGFFETIDDPEVARALIDRVSEQGRAVGAEILRGPRNLSRVEEIGVLIEGFDTPQPMLAGHSPRYYQSLLEGLGLRTHHDVLAYDIEVYDEQGQERPLPEKLEVKAAQVDIPGLEVRPATRLGLSQDLRIAHEVFVEAFRDVPDNTPMPLEEFVTLGRIGILLSSRRMLQLATVNGKTAGFALCFPELNEALARARGRLFPVGWARILNGLRQRHTASFKLIGVVPEYRKSGLHALMIKRAVEGIKEARYRRLEASLVDARNKPSRAVVEGAGMEIYRRYRMYERSL